MADVLGDEDPPLDASVDGPGPAEAELGSKGDEDDDDDVGAKIGWGAVGAVDGERTRTRRTRPNVPVPLRQARRRQQRAPTSVSLRPPLAGAEAWSDELGDENVPRVSSTSKRASSAALVGGSLTWSTGLLGGAGASIAPDRLANDSFGGGIAESRPFAG